MRTIQLLFIVAAILFNLSFTYAAESNQEYWLYFPKINLSQGNSEYIEEIHLSVACGHIKTIDKIPDDWNIEIVRMISGVETLNASAGHGASRLSEIEKLNGAIRIIVGEKGCFKVTGTILVSGKNIRQVELSHSELILKP
jgi:hypothetical protein